MNIPEDDFEFFDEPMDESGDIMDPAEEMDEFTAEQDYEYEDTDDFEEEELDDM
ncbi:MULTISPECIES: hypothetical protein [unclassified Siphonobacter]|uniref:hypothetical protein n=1 Tax=unclassified Siphonobacter TaxID=2635712 RepID=UPI0012FF16AC|nr:MULTISPECIES: hypothetical protein [unclassified Siphonobacter]MDQ1087382.1 hypothetical protein [Siphonobacter sp. SORGH_AS_1065]MDR6193536.1 hypothetical protein [Siphonobacter sp. SORGH_AS_0500]